MYTKCQKCGKKLTDPESQRRGYGPECWGKVTGVPLKKNESDGLSNDYEVPGQMSIFDFKEIGGTRNNEQC